MAIRRFDRATGTVGIRDTHALLVAALVGAGGHEPVPYIIHQMHALVLPSDRRNGNQTASGVVVPRDPAGSPYVLLDVENFVGRVHGALLVKFPAGLLRVAVFLELAEVAQAILSGLSPLDGAARGSDIRS